MRLSGEFRLTDSIRPINLGTQPGRYSKGLDSGKKKRKKKPSHNECSGSSKARNVFAETKSWRNKKKSNICRQYSTPAHRHKKENIILAHAFSGSDTISPRN